MDLLHSIMSAQSVILGMYPDQLDKLNLKQFNNEAIWAPPINLTIPLYIKEQLKNSSISYDIPVIPIRINIGDVKHVRGIRSYTWKFDKMLQLELCPAFQHYTICISY